MSTILGGRSFLAHDVNPCIPDLIRPHSTSYHHLYSRCDSRGRNDPSPRLSPNERVLKPSSLLSSVTADRPQLNKCERLSSQHPPPSQSSTLTSPTAPIPNPPSCAKCSKQILDQYLCRIRDQSWHEKCAVCSVCSACLSDVCFLYEGELYCRRDYDRLHVIRCANCRQPMRSHELFMCAQTPHTEDQSNNPAALIFHVSCFTCSVCQQPLAAGDAYTVDAGTNRLICRPDFLASRSRAFSVQSILSSSAISSSVASQPMLSEHPVSASGRGDNNSSNFCPTNPPSAALLSHHRRSYGSNLSLPPFYTHIDGGTGCSKRVRTSLTDEQRFHLQKAYEQTSRPSKHARECLAKQLSVPVRVVQVWFQNQRARDKRALTQHHHLNSRQHSDWSSSQENHLAIVSTNHSPGELVTRTSLDKGHYPESRKTSPNRRQRNITEHSIPSVEHTRTPTSKTLVH